MATDVFVALIPVRPGQEQPLQAALEGFGTGWARPFARVPGTHAVRLVVLRSFGARDEPRRRLHPTLLSFSAMVDGAAVEWLETMCTTLGTDGAGLWAHCAGWPGSDPSACAQWLLSFRLRLHLCITGNRGASVEAIESALERRNRLRALAVLPQNMSAHDLRSAYEEGLGRMGAVRR